MSHAIGWVDLALPYKQMHGKDWLRINVFPWICTDDGRGHGLIFTLGQFDVGKHDLKFDFE